VNFRRVEGFVKEHQEDGVPLLPHIDGAQALVGLAVRKEATPLDRQPARPAVHLFDGVITSIPCWCELDAENSSGFVFCNLAGDTERLSRHGAITPRELLCIP
jgi:hypothetical protein